MSDFFEQYYAARGVRFIKSATVMALKGDGAVNATMLSSGQSVPCDMVIAGIGVLPVTEMLANSDIKVADGILVNEFLETSQPDIYAAGDVANYEDVLFMKRRRVEHWDNAVSQGQYCARALLGEQLPFKHVPYFFSDIFDLSYEYWGDSSLADKLVYRGDLSSKSFSVWWLRQKQVAAAFIMNRPDEEREIAPKWIEGKQTVVSARLEDPTQSVKYAAE
jgi:NADPH-dependent 2,4-dienoyl-CoA reductase/sulfur reductase-like enzyme